MLSRLRRTPTLSGDKGFTLIELLVVMIIIGILAAIAVPIFSNQQKSARDTAVTSDVRNIAGEVQSLMVGQPENEIFSITAPVGGIATLTVGTRTSDVSMTGGTSISVKSGATVGSFQVCGLNPKGKMYATAALVYDNSLGGMLSGATPLSDCGEATLTSGNSGGTGGTGSGGSAIEAPGLSTNLTMSVSNNLGAAAYTVMWDTPTTGGIVDSYTMVVTAFDSSTNVIVGTSTSTVSGLTTTATVGVNWISSAVNLKASVTATNSGGSSTATISGGWNASLPTPGGAYEISATFDPTSNLISYEYVAIGGTWNGNMSAITAYARLKAWFGTSGSLSLFLKCHDTNGVTLSSIQTNIVNYIDWAIPPSTTTYYTSMNKTRQCPVGTTSVTGSVTVISEATSSWNSAA